MIDYLLHGNQRKANEINQVKGKGKIQSSTNTKEEVGRTAGEEGGPERLVNGVTGDSQEEVVAKGSHQSDPGGEDSIGFLIYCIRANSMLT